MHSHNVSWNVSCKDLLNLCKIQEMIVALDEKKEVVQITALIASIHYQWHDTGEASICQE